MPSVAFLLAFASEYETWHQDDSREEQELDEHCPERFWTTSKDGDRYSRRRERRGCEAKTCGPRRRSTTRQALEDRDSKREREHGRQQAHRPEAQPPGGHVVDSEDLVWGSVHQLRVYGV